MSTRLQEKENALYETFEWIEDPLDKYELIMDMGKKLAALDSIYHQENYQVKGCQSAVWLRAYKKDDLIYYEADSNTIITKGLVAILVQLLSGESANTILMYDFAIIDRLDLRSHLSSQRNNGFSAMIEKMKWYATIL